MDKANLWSSATVRASSFTSIRCSPRFLRAVLLASPLMRDPDSGEIFSIFKRLAQLAPLAVGLGTQGGFEMPSFDLNELWVGPMFNSAHLRQGTNDAAARAVRAWVVAEGLAVEIERIRAEETEAPPAPGLARLRERVDHAAKRAAAAADPAWNLCERVKKYAAAVGATDTPDGKAVRRMQEAEEQLIAAYKEASELEILKTYGRIEQDALAKAFARRFLQKPYRGYVPGAAGLLRQIAGAETGVNCRRSYSTAGHSEMGLQCAPRPSVRFFAMT